MDITTVVTVHVELNRGSWRPDFYIRKSTREMGIIEARTCHFFPDCVLIVYLLAFPCKIHICIIYIEDAEAKRPAWTYN